MNTSFKDNTFIIVIVLSKRSVPQGEQAYLQASPSYIIISYQLKYFRESNF